MDKVKELKKELLRYGKKIAEAGLVIGSGGNISIRHKNTIYMKARGISLGRATVRDFPKINIDNNETTLINKVKLTSEFRMHLLCYLVRPDIGAVVHTHPPLAFSLANKIRTIKITSLEIKVAIGSRNIPVVKDLPSGSQELAEAVAKKVRKYNVVLLKNHGLVTMGKDLDEAYTRALAVEQLA